MVAPTVLVRTGTWSISSRLRTDVSMSSYPDMRVGVESAYADSTNNIYETKKHLLKPKI
jgi:hypothetical protein